MSSATGLSVLAGIFLYLLLSECSCQRILNEDCLRTKSEEQRNQIQVSEWPELNVEESTSGQYSVYMQPERPKDVQIKRRNKYYDAPLSVQWKPGRLLYLRYFVLKITEEREEFRTREGEDRRAYTSSYYILVNVSQHENMNGKLHRLVNKCIHVNSNTQRLHVRVWSLNNVSVNGDMLSFPAIEACSKSHQINIESPLKDAINCICNTKVTLSLMKVPDQSVLTGTVFIKGNTTAVSFEVSLLSNGEVIATNYSIRSITWRNLSPGSYSLRVKLFCEAPIETDCGRTSGQIVTTKEVKIPNTVVVTSASALKGPVKEETQDGPRVVYVAMAYALTTGLVVLFLIGLIIYVARRYLNLKSNRHQNNSPCRVAILYTPELDSTHVSKVKAFAHALSGCGVLTTLIDEDHRPGMKDNWIEEGEDVAEEFDNFVFVVSPRMQKICLRRDSPSNSRHQSVSSESDESELLYHRLPVVVINSCKCKILANGEREPELHSVLLGTRTAETELLAEKFRLEHRSMFTNQTMYIAANNMELSSNKEFKKLVRKLKRRAKAPHRLISFI